MLWSAFAYAAPTDEEKAIARALFEQGRAMTKAGQWAEACPKLAESQRLDPGMGTLYNLADCHEHVGKLAAAWAEFSEVLDSAKRAGQTEREKIARDRVNALNGRIARVTLRKKAPLPAGSDIVLDGKSIGLAVIDVPVPIDPGEHKVAVIDGARSTEKAFTVPTSSGGAPIEVELPMPVATIIVPTPPPPPVETPPPASTTRNTWHRPVAYGAGGAGVAAIGASIALGFVAKGQWNDADGQCPNDRCTDRGFRAWEDARSTATIGTVVFIGGVVLVAAATVLWLIAPSPSSAPRTATATR